MVKFIRNRADISAEIMRAQEFLNNSNGKYNNDDVLQALSLIFYNKCYICENSYSTTYNIEHLVPHRGNAALKSDWNNLFLSCGHCNNIKSDKYDDILDCTQIHPDKSISFQYTAYIYDADDDESVRIKPLEQNDSTINTVKLLNDIYLGTTCMKKIESANLRKLLHDEMIKFKSDLQAYEKYLSNNDVDAIEDVIELLKRHLDCSSAFTAFKRWYIIDNREKYSILYDYLTNQIYI